MRWYLFICRHSRGSLCLTSGYDCCMWSRAPVQWPLGVVPAAGLTGAGGGGAERGEVAGGARRAQARQHGRLLRLGGVRRLARPAQRARRRPHREHECQHGRLSSHAPPSTPARTPTTIPWKTKHRSEFTLTFLRIVSVRNIKSLTLWRQQHGSTWGARASERASHARAAGTTLGSPPSRRHARYTMHNCYRHYW